jgi:ethanolamine utilization protein EutN
MQLANVIGYVTSKTRQQGLADAPLLLVQDVEPAGPWETLSVPARIAVDLVGAREGDLVILAGGGAARVAPKTIRAPADLAVVAVVDQVVDQGAVTYQR